MASVHRTVAITITASKAMATSIITMATTIKTLLASTDMGSRAMGEWAFIEKRVFLSC